MTLDELKQAAQVAKAEHDRLVNEHGQRQRERDAQQTILDRATLADDPLKLAAGQIRRNQLDAEIARLDQVIATAERRATLASQELSNTTFDVERARQFLVGVEVPPGLVDRIRDAAQLIYATTGERHDPVVLTIDTQLPTDQAALQGASATP